MPHRAPDSPGPSLTRDQRRQLTLRASTVFERPALLDASPGHRTDDAPPTDAARTVWRAWVQAFSPGDAAALERRLSWDDIDLAHLTRALSDDWLPEASADWVDWADDLTATARALGVERRALAPGIALPERDLFDGPPPPFLDLLIPVLRVVRQARTTTAAEAGLLEAFTPQAWRAIDRHLLCETSRLAELSFFDAFRDARAERAVGYDTFVRDMLERDYAPFLFTHAVLARQLACIARRSVAATLELLMRLKADRAALAGTFGTGREMGAVAAIEPALSDPHDGGRRVAMLSFETGLQVVYKPRPVHLEHAFGRWLEWADARGLDPPQRAPRTLDRGEYGWMEVIAQDAFETMAQVREYYRRSGGLLCLAHVLRARDLHMENVVATREGPVAIDLELLLQPVSANEAMVGQAVAATLDAEPASDAASVPQSCLTSGLLTLVVSRDGRRFDIGGLRGTGEGLAARAARVWHGLDTDAIHYTEEATFRVRVANAVVLNGVAQAPDDHADAVLAGFTETYGFLLARREEMLAEGGGLSVFAGTRARVLPRPTVQYGTLLHVLARPALQKDGRRWSLAHDALNRPFNEATVRPRAWDALVAERRALERLDVPHFTVDVDGAALRTGGRLVEGYFVRSGLSAVAERLGRMSPADLADQRERLARALSQPVSGRFHVAPPPDSDATAEGDASDEGLLAHAAWIAEEMLDRVGRGSSSGPHAPLACLDADQVRRCSLYDGSLGPILFLSAMAAVTGDGRYADAATRDIAAFGAVLASTRPHAGVNLGAASGLGSIVYGLTLGATLLGDALSLESARSVALAIGDEQIEADSVLDVYGGSAGAVLALLALYRVTSDQLVLARARRCGERLLQDAVPGGRTSGLAPGRSTLVGFAHGVAGVAHALGQLFEVTGDGRFGDAARESWRYVAGRFLRGQGNWPIAGAAADAGAATHASMVAWCHGAPGVLLAATLGNPDLLDVEWFDQVDAALRTTATVPAHAADHVCCGNLGRVEALSTVGRRLQRRDALDAARQLASRTLARARSEGCFGLGGGAFDQRVFDPGFFRGLSGIGYTLLRLTAPTRLPCVLAFAPPRSWGRESLPVS